MQQQCGSHEHLADSWQYSKYISRLVAALREGHIGAFKTMHHSKQVLNISLSFAYIDSFFRQEPNPRKHRI